MCIRDRFDAERDLDDHAFRAGAHVNSLWLATAGTSLPASWSDLVDGVVARRGPRPRLPVVIDADKRTADLEFELAFLRRRLVRDQVRAGRQQASLDDVQGELVEARRELRDAQGQVDALRASRSYRLGRSILRPVRWARAVGRR